MAAASCEKVHAQVKRGGVEESGKQFREDALRAFAPHREFLLTLPDDVQGVHLVQTRPCRSLSAIVTLVSL
jgi:hypothetical protein